MKIIYEDKNLLVIDKPAGLVVHPGAAKETDTVVDWLISNYPDVKTLSWPDPARPGIVHRLDKDTSGLMILAKNPTTLSDLQNLIQERRIKKTYLVLVNGSLDKKEGEITGFIGRDPNARRQQAARTISFDWQPGKVREAKTFYKVLKEYTFDKKILTLVEATLDTGRMHQIRVHFKSIDRPVIGDSIYNNKMSRGLSKKLGLARQFLHAYKLSFKYLNLELSLKSALPKDLQEVLQKVGEYDRVE